jgi:3-phenylpropionate/trans-cinnamate dioxygenase ferredoxin reductase component
VPAYDYLIIGGGMTAEYAVRGIRSVDASRTIGIISNDTHPPYKRPPLSKALWKGEPVESIWLRAATEHAQIHTGVTATAIDRSGRSVTDDRGQQYKFRKLLLATGGRVRTLPGSADGIVYFRSFDDYERLRQIVGHKQRFVVIGGGFTGSEVAAALAMNGSKVTIMFPEKGIGTRIYPAGLAQYITGYFEGKGVRVMAETSVAGIAQRGETYVITTNTGKEIVADGVIAGIGIMPNVELARAAGLTIGNGIVVNAQLQTSDPDIFAAGDVAEFFNPSLSRRLRLEHEDNAKVMGEHAGRNMAGRNDPYTHLPFFYSDLFELGYEAVGLLNSSLKVVEDWKEKYKEGIVYYLEDTKLVGVLLWNTWDQVDKARQLIAGGGEYTEKTIRGKLPA